MERRNFFAIVGSVLAYSPFARDADKKKKPTGKAVGASKQCSTCVQYSAITGGTTGNCQRYPKVWITTTPTSSGWSFPVMNATDICGEYQWEAQTQ